MKKHVVRRFITSLFRPSPPVRARLPARPSIFPPPGPVSNRRWPNYRPVSQQTRIKQNMDRNAVASRLGKEKLNGGIEWGRCLASFVSF